MNPRKPVYRGEIYYADLAPTVGSEQGGIRPVLIVQNDIANRTSTTTVVLSLTSVAHKKKSCPLHFCISARSGLKYDSIVLIEQIRTIDKVRLLTQIAIVSKYEMMQIERLLRLNLDMSIFR